jgi:vacuolar-type H+-ATPase subunit H
MSGVVEGTVEALVEFESALDRIKSEASEAKKRMVKSAGELAASAKASALSKAHELATMRLDAVRKEAGVEAESIRKNGDIEMKKFEQTISRHKKEAAELVTRWLLGES